MSRLGRAIGVAVLVAAAGMVMRFPGALPGPRVVSAHDHLSVHPLFQEGDDRGRVTHPHLSDPALQLAALDKRTVASLRRGEAPLWNPDIYMGAPLLGDAQSRPLSPVTLLRVPPWSASLAQDLGVAWLLLWSALGWGLLGGRLLRSDDETRRIAVAVGAAVGLTTPFLSVWLLHPHASTVVWLPWGLLALEAHSAWALALATFGLLTGGHPGTMVHVGGLWAGWWTVRSRRPAPLLGLAAGVLLAAPLWAPVLEQAERSTTLAARVGGTLLPRQLADLLWPGALGHPVADTWQGPGAWADGQLHPGLGAMALAVWGAAQRKVGVVHLAWALFLLCGLAAVVGLPGPIAHGRLLGLSVALLAIPAAAAVALLPGGRWRWGVPLVVLLTGTHARWNDQNTVQPDVHEAEPAAWARPLMEVAEGSRAIGVGWALQPNTGALAGLRDVRGYDLPVSVDTHRLMTALNRAPRGPWYPLDKPPSELQRRWLGINVVAVFPEQPASLAKMLPEWTPLEQAGDAPLDTYVAPMPAKMAWLAGAATRFPNPDRALHFAFSVKYATLSVPVEVPVDAIGQPAALFDAERVERGGSAIDLTFDAQEQPTVAVASEAWAPGWRARLSNGTAVAPLRVGGLVLGAAIPPGVDGVSFYYRPDGWIVGQRLFLGGLLLLLGLVMWRLWGHRLDRVRL